MNRKIPGPYRGYRYSRKKRWLFALVIVLLLAVLAFIVFEVLQNFLVFSSDGAHLDFSGGQQEEENAGALQPPNFQIEDSGSSVTPDTPPETSEDRLSTAAVYIDTQRVGDTAYREQIKQIDGINTVIIEVKTPEGQVLFPSQIAPENAQAQVIQQMQEAVQDFSNAGLTVVARMSALRDDIAPRTAFRDSAIKTGSGAVWLDRQSIAWFSPFGEQTAEYLSALIAEIQAMGFDEVLLESLCFPTVGKTELITYGSHAQDDRVAAIDGLLQQLLQKTDGKIRISVMLLYQSAGEEQQTGQSVKNILEAVPVYSPLEDPSQQTQAYWTAQLSDMELQDGWITLWLEAAPDDATKAQMEAERIGWAIPAGD